MIDVGKINVAHTSECQYDEHESDEGEILYKVFIQVAHQE